MQRAARLALLVVTTGWLLAAADKVTARTLINLTGVVVAFAAAWLAVPDAVVRIRRETAAAGRRLATRMRLRREPPTPVITGNGNLVPSHPTLSGTGGVPRLPAGSVDERIALLHTRLSAVEVALGLLRLQIGEERADRVYAVAEAESSLRLEWTS